MIVPKRVYGCANASVDDDLEEREGGTDGVSMESECGGCCQKTVHNIVGVRSETDEKEQLWALFDGADDALDAGARLKPAFDRVAEEGA